MPTRLAAVALLPLLTTLPAQDRAPDPRDVAAGWPIPAESYCDQPRVVTLSDGTWVCVLTTGPGHEGQRGQHVVATRSTDRGRTWSEAVDVEAGDPERPASYAVSYVTPYDRVYAFYTYNGDAVWARPGPDGEPRDEIIRADTHGWWCFRYSDDAGRTWSERHRIPMRVTACDRANDWGGEVQMFWAIGDPVTTTDGAVVFAFTKLRRYFLVDGEGWFWRSDNLASERDPERLHFELLPEGDHGLRHPDFGSVQEEFNVVPLPDGGLICVYRTTRGFPAVAYSTDGGRHWSEPEPLRYRPGGPVLRNPRACPKLWQVGAGRYLFWFHHHGGADFRGRNPAWLAAAVLRDGRLRFSQPEVVLYGADRSYATGRFSYPDLIREDGRWFLVETQKTVARVHELQAALIDGLFAQLEAGTGPDGPTAAPLCALRGGGSTTMPRLPDLSAGRGFAVELAVDAAAAGEEPLVSAAGALELRVVRDEGRAHLQLRLDDGSHTATWTSDPLPAPRAGHPTRAVLIVDGGPDLFTAVVDGHLDDGLAPGGTAHRQRGFGWFDADLGALGPAELRTAAALHRLRIHGRALRTAEAVALTAPR